MIQSGGGRGVAGEGPSAGLKLSECVPVCARDVCSVRVCLCCVCM